MTVKPDALELKLPPNFQQILIEVVDPAQSVDYYDLGNLTFPVRVLPIGMEKKLLRLKNIEGEQFELIYPKIIGDLCCFYYSHLTINWPVDNASQDQIMGFYVKHLEKMRYNDEVMAVVAQIYDKIEWKQIDEKSRAEIERYIPAYVFSPVFLYLNIIENSSINQIFSSTTRGLLEIIKLSNRIANDKMRRLSDGMGKEKEVAMSDEIAEEMAKAKTSDEYLNGLMKQGFFIK